MKNEKFWNECTDGSIRKKIAEFIDKNPSVSHLKEKTYYDFEDALVAFIYDNRDMISKEVDLEYQRDDFLSQAKEEFGEDIEEAVKAFPIVLIDNMIDIWQEALSETDEYWDITWETLSEVMTDGGISPLVGIGDYDKKDTLIYAAYLNEWYSEMPQEMQGQDPSCIDEFFSCEMEDEEIRSFYIKAANKIFGDKMKQK